VPKARTTNPCSIPTTVHVYLSLMGSLGSPRHSDLTLPKALQVASSSC
jgi:hypothetical protein